jgi:hypothetical protein
VEVLHTNAMMNERNHTLFHRTRKETIERAWVPTMVPTWAQRGVGACRTCAPMSTERANATVPSRSRGQGRLKPEHVPRVLLASKKAAIEAGTLTKDAVDVEVLKVGFWYKLKLTELFPSERAVSRCIMEVYTAQCGAQHPMYNATGHCERDGGSGGRHGD